MPSPDVNALSSAIQRLERERSSQVLVLGASHMELELLPELYETCRTIGRVPRLDVVLQEMLAPIRERREHFAQDKGQVLQMLKEGTMKARETAAQTMDEVRRALGLSYF